MTKPTVERAPVEEAWLKTAEGRWRKNGLAIQIPPGLEESIRADEATRWREAVQAIVDSLERDSFTVTAGIAAKRRLRSLLQEEDS